ncbi:hypothetical protein Tco_0454942 [Tanacetum coccineum]
MVSKLNQNHHGTSVNTKFDKLSALRNKLYSITPLPKYQFISKVVEINYLSKIITSHLHTNTIIKKCTKVLAPGLLKIEELLEQTRALKPLDENLDYACKVVQRIQELLVYVSASCPFIVSENEKWAPATSHKKNNKLYVDTLGRVSYTNSSRSQPRINTKNDRIQRPSSKSEKNTIVEIVLWYLDSGCSKHMTAIMGYDDLQFGNVLITGVYYVEGLGHNLFSTRQFCDSDLELAKQDLVRGFPELKYAKDHLCFACQMGKRKKESRKPKTIPSSNEKLHMLHMDLCGPMWVESINGTKYILVIFDDYSWFTWQQFDMEDVGITHQMSVARTLQQNGVVERRNHTLVEAARTMLIFSKSPFMAEDYWKPDLKFLHVFGALCYPTNNSKDLGKLKPKADIGIFIGYSPSKKAYRIYNKRTRMIMETIHVQFDELT